MLFPLPRSAENYFALFLSEGRSDERRRRDGVKRAKRAERRRLEGRRGFCVRPAPRAPNRFRPILLGLRGNLGAGIFFGGGWVAKGKKERKKFFFFSFVKLGGVGVVGEWLSVGCSARPAVRRTLCGRSPVLCARRPLTRLTPTRAQVLGILQRA